MRSSQLNRTLKIIRRTGDKVIILDRDSDEAFVLMDLDNYENVLDMADFPSDGDSGDEVDEACEEGNEECCDDLGCEGRTKKADVDNLLEDYVLDDVIASETGMPEIKIEPISKPDSAEIKNNIISEEGLEDVPHEEQDTFLLEPVE